MKTFFRGFSVFSLVLILVAAMAFPVFAQSGGPDPVTVQPAVPTSFAQQLILMVLGAVISVCVPVVSVALRKKAEQDTARIKSTMTSGQYEMLRGLAYDGVRSAKQRGLIGELEQEGAKLREYVVKQLQTAADQQGIPINVDQIVDMVEAAYHDMAQPIFQDLTAELKKSEPSN